MLINPPTPSNPTILLVDDDESLLELLSMRLSAEGFRPTCVDNVEDALLFLEHSQPQVVLSDLRMDGKDGLDLFDLMQQRWPNLPLVIMTAHGSIQEAVKATQEGVFAFLTKPIDNIELRRVLQMAVMCNSRPFAADEFWRQEIITQNSTMNELLEQARLIAAGDASVLITGQSGTGKEVLAKAIHKASPRSAQPFVCINCGAIPEDLLESELFGHKKGSFTGAYSDQVGLFETADQGSLFLDEIGDMPLKLQVKLLRVIQERTIRPVGSNRDIALDVRILSATHKDLLAEAQAGRFREDLYYRLNVVNLNLPSLDARKEDIPLLIKYFLKSISARANSRLKHFTPQGLELLISFNWPGNIRQLANAIEQSVVLSNSTVIPLSIVQKVLKTPANTLQSLSDAKRDFERAYVIRLLKMTEGNITHAAKLAQRNRSDFHKILKRHNVEADSFKKLLLIDMQKGDELL